APGTGGAAGSAAARRRTGERLAALFVVGVALLNFPLLSVIRGRSPVAGLPAAFVYLFVVWALLALATALVLRRRGAEPRDGGDEPRARRP
ncbi:MAG TPA: hypothetical protein VI078_11460, partial [bacterium]